MTHALIHQHTPTREIFSYDHSESFHQDSNTFERLPEEDVSIVDTLEGREDGPETVRAITSASTRRKLYFNPAFFDFELLLVRVFIFQCMYQLLLIVLSIFGNYTVMLLPIVWPYIEDVFSFV